MANAIWIDEFDADTRINEVGFLVLRQNQNERGCPEKYTVRERPAHTNQSHQPRLWGWCGTTNNIAVYAHGLAKVVRVTKNGRALLARVEPTEAVLESLGYPTLIDQQQ